MKSRTGYFVLGLCVFLLVAAKITTDNLKIGNGTAEDVAIEFDVGNGTTNPKVRWNNTDSQLEFTNNGVDILAFGSGSGGGAAGVNLIADPTRSSNWEASGAGFTVETTGIASELPLSPQVETGIKLTPVSGTDYARYRFTVPDTFKTTKMKLEFYMKPVPGYADSDLKIEIYNNENVGFSGAFTEIPLSTDSSGDTFLPSAEGRIIAYFDSTDLDAMELRFVRVTGNTAIVVQNVFAGVSDITTSPIIADWQSYTPTSFPGLGTLSDVNLEYRRVGSQMEIRGWFKLGTPTADPMQFTIPGSLTVGGSSSDSTNAGYYIRDEASVAGSGWFIATGGDSFLGMAELDIRDSSNINGLIPRIGSSAFTAGSRTSVKISVPIAEWQGSGVVNVLNDDILRANERYRYTSDDTSVQFANNLSTVIPYEDLDYDVAGGSYNPSTGIFTAATDGVYRFFAAVGFSGGSSCSMQVRKNGVALIRRDKSASPACEVHDTLQVVAGDEITFTGTNFVNNAVRSGSSTNNYMSIQRISEYTAGAPVGFGLLSGDAAGLYPSEPSALDGVIATKLGLKEYSHTTDFTITTVNGIWTVSYATARPYQMSDGSWWMKFVLNASGDSQVAQVFEWPGVTSVNANFALAAAEGSNDSAVDCVWTTNISQFICRRAAGTNFNGIAVSGEVKLTSKPTWAD